MRTVSSGFVVINRRGEVLLGMVDNHEPPYQWTFFKGGQEGEESLMETAIRELKEETGIDIAADHKLNKYISTNYIYQYSVRQKDVYMFCVEDVEGVLEDFNFACNSYWGDNNKPEIACYKWVNIDDLKQYVFPSQRGLAEFLQRRKGEYQDCSINLDRQKYKTRPSLHSSCSW